MDSRARFELLYARHAAWEGLSPTQAAAALELKPSTARVRLMRARRRLAAALTNEQTVALAAAEVR